MCLSNTKAGTAVPFCFLLSDGSPSSWLHSVIAGLWTGSGAHGGLWLSHLTLGRLMAGEPPTRPLATQPCHLARPQPTVSRYLLRRNPSSGSTLIIPHWVAGSGATVPLALASAMDRQNGARNSCTWLRFSAHVECFEAGLCFRGSVAYYIPIWPPWRESCLVGLEDTAPRGVESDWNKDTVFSSCTNQLRVIRDSCDFWSAQQNVK